MEEEKKVVLEIKDNKIIVGLDLDQDGEKSLSLEVSLNEALQEILSRGEPVEGAKAVSVKFELTKLSISIDSDKDGEKLLDLSIDLGEAFSEVYGLMKKDDEAPKE